MRDSVSLKLLLRRNLSMLSCWDSEGWFFASVTHVTILNR